MSFHRGALLDAHAPSTHRRLCRGARARHRLGAIHDRARLPPHHQTGRTLGELDDEGNPISDPYTKAHLARSGRLPLTSTTARYFTANTDSEGDTLISTCEYSIEGGALNARWWSIAVYDEHGSLIDNPSQRYSFNSEEAIRHSDGSYRITLAGNARPENWLPSGSGPERNLVLMLRIYSPRETDSSGIGQIPDDRLPKIERKSCT